MARSAALHRELERRGLTVLGVGEHRRHPAGLCVYLHGNDGQWVNGVARRMVAGLPGVVSVRESAYSPSILVVLTDGHPGTDANPG